ncbi:MAG TPA: LytTR family DNA-binding domain-containing protein [Chitinophagaceae bacterium]|nr:LytTR family DNA-binding domain-containing protein [Chitinophagaceae bacterium]
MRAIIVDDEPEGISILQKMLVLRCKQVEVIATCTNAIEGKLKIKELNPDLVFLEAQMPDHSGFEMLRDLDSNNFQVIFVTGDLQYMPRALQLHATDCLVKPFDEDRLTEAIRRVENKRRQQDDSMNWKGLLYSLQRTGFSGETKLCVPTFKGFAVLKLEDIILCEAEKNYTIIHIKDKKPIVVSRPLLEYEKMLEHAPFLRIHRTFLINLQHVVEYHRGEGGVVIMSNGAEVEVSRRKKELFLSRIKGGFWN